MQKESIMAKKTNRPKSLNDIPESPDDMLVTKKMLDYTHTNLESKIQAGFSRLEGMIHMVAAETSRTLLLMEQQRSENRMFFEAFGLTKDRHAILESRVERVEKKLGI